MSELQTLTVLLVDDDRMLLDCMFDVLSYIGHRVILSGNRAEAEAALAAEAPEVIVSDWDLDGDPATPLFQIVRAHHPATGRVLLTGSAPGDWKPLEAEGLFHLALRKPCELSELTSAMEMSRAMALARTRTLAARGPRRH